MRRLIGTILSCIVACNAGAAAEYRGRFSPDAEYVLSGKLAADLPPLPDVPFSLEAPGFRDDLLSQVPPVGVHPRVVLSPCDIDEIKANIAKGEDADVTFRVCLRELRNKAASPKPLRDTFGNAPWGGIGVIAAKGLLALLADDQELGREAAQWTVKHAQFLQPRMELLNTHPDARAFKDNFYYFSRAGVRVGGLDYATAYREGGADRVRELAGKGVEFFGQDNQWAYTSLGAEYDYCEPFMTDAQRDYVRSVISRSTSGKYTTGMEIPGHFFINNHMSMGAEFYAMLLSIEGEEGFDVRAAEQCVPRLMDKLTYDISPDGILYENVKGFIPLYPIYAAGRRGERNHLKHDHLRAWFEAKAHASENIQNRYFQRGRNRPGLRLPEVGEGNDDPRFWVLGADSGPGGHAAFVWGWVLKRLFPEDPIIDYCYKIGLQTANFDVFDGSEDETNYGGKIHYNTRNLIDLMLLCATDGARDGAGDVIDYQRTGLPESLKKKPMAWKDMNRGLARVRSGWDKDDMVISYECRSDVYYGGHETPEQGDFRFSADGVLWSPYTGPYMDAYFRNMVLVDGYAGVYQPTPGKLLKVANTDAAATIVSDATEAYRWKKQEKNFYHWHDMLKTAPCFTDWLRNRGWRMNRDWELPFQPHMRVFYDGFAHLDWGPWHGETRGPEYYERWNDMEYVFRTLHLARGKHPYVLIVDDLKKDDAPHQYDWNFALSGEVRLFKADSAAKNRHLEKGTAGAIGTDLILCLGDAARKRKPTYGNLPNIEYEPKAGDPMLLVRVLWRNTSFPYPLPSFEQTWQFNRIKIPAYAVEPEFKVLLYPYRFGEPLPFTRWSDDRSELLVSFDGQEDAYIFQRGTGGRTVFAMRRNGQPVITTTSRPAPPELKNMGGHTPDRNLPESEQRKRTLRFADRLDVALAEPAPGCEIRHTLDGSAPNEGSTLYTGPIRITGDCELKAVTVHHGWVFGKSISEPLAVACRRIPASPPIQPDTSQQAGLACEVFSIHHTIFEEDSGFYTGHKNMLPELAETHRLAQVAVNSFTIPSIGPKALKSEMHKGYYRYRGLLHAPTGGVYRFRVFSCGPICMTVAGQDVLDVTGPYGLSQKHRYGECVVQEGPHPIELTVCDPVFWKGDSFMDLRVGVRQPDDTDYRPVPDSWMTRSATQQLETPVELTTRATAVPVNVTDLQPGLVEESHDWSDRVTRDTADFVEGSATYAIPNDGLPANFLDGLGKSTPYQRQTVWSLSGSDNLNRLTRYVGFFRAVRAGDYAFRTDPSGANRLTIGKQVVASVNIQGCEPVDLLHLEPGLYPLDFVNLFGSGELRVRSPGSDEFRPAVPGQLGCEAKQEALPDTRGPVAVIDFESITNNVVAVQSERPLTARLSGAEAVATPFGQGVAFTGANPYLELSGLQWPAPACTVSMWLKRGKSGDSLALRGMPNKFQVRLRSRDAVWANYHRSPDAVHIQAGEKVANKDWFHLAVTFGEWVKVYVDGKLVGSRIVDPSAMYPGSSAYPASMLFMENETNGQLDEVRIFNRVLSENEIRKIATQ